MEKRSSKLGGIKLRIWLLRYRSLFSPFFKHTLFYNSTSCRIGWSVGPFVGPKCFLLHFAFLPLLYCPRLSCRASGLVLIVADTRLSVCLSCCASRSVSQSLTVTQSWYNFSATKFWQLMETAHFASKHGRRGSSRSETSPRDVNLCDWRDKNFETQESHR